MPPTFFVAAAVMLAALCAAPLAVGLAVALVLPRTRAHARRAWRDGAVGGAAALAVACAAVGGVTLAFGDPFTPDALSGIVGAAAAGFTAGVVVLPMGRRWRARRSPAT